MRRAGFGARHGGHDTKGRTRSPASRSIPLATAQREFRRGDVGGGTRLQVSAGRCGGGHAAASPDLDIAGFRVAQGLGHATGDTTRRV